MGGKVWAVKPKLEPLCWTMEVGGEAVEVQVERGSRQRWIKGELAVGKRYAVAAGKGLWVGDKWRASAGGWVDLGEEGEALVAWARMIGWPRDGSV